MGCVKATRLVFQTREGVEHTSLVRNNGQGVVGVSSTPPSHISSEGGGVLETKGGKWEAISVKYTICGDVKQMRQEGFAPRRVNEVKQT